MARGLTPFFGHLARLAFRLLLHYNELYPAHPLLGEISVHIPTPGATASLPLATTLSSKTTMPSTVLATTKKRKRAGQRIKRPVAEKSNRIYSRQVKEAHYFPQTQGWYHEEGSPSSLLVYNLGSSCRLTRPCALFIRLTSFRPELKYCFSSCPRPDWFTLSRPLSSSNWSPTGEK